MKSFSMCMMNILLEDSLYAARLNDALSVIGSDGKFKLNANKFP